MYFIYKCPFCLKEVIGPAPKGLNEVTAIRSCKKCGGRYSNIFTAKELITVKDLGNTYQATFGKVKASATSGREQAARAVAAKLDEFNDVEYITTQDGVDYYEIVLGKLSA